MDGDRQAAAQRLLAALDLFVDGEALMRHNLQRRRPEASAAEIEQVLTAWVRSRPGAERGDCPGRLISLDR